MAMEVIKQILGKKCASDLKKIKDLDADKIVRNTLDKEYYVMIPSHQFPGRRRKYMDIAFLKRLSLKNYLHSKYFSNEIK